MPNIVDITISARNALLPGLAAAQADIEGWTRDAQGRLWFDPSQVREMARIQRLRISLNLGYSAIGLVVELLDRIAELERKQRRMPRGGAPWT